MAGAIAASGTTNVTPPVSIASPGIRKNSDVA